MPSSLVRCGVCGDLGGADPCYGCSTAPPCEACGEPEPHDHCDTCGEATTNAIAHECPPGFTQ